MQETIYDRINSILTWKRIAAFNVVLLLALIIPLSIRLANQDTELRSNAAGEDVIVKEPTPPPSYPQLPPKIERVNTFYGKPGDSVVVIGENFGEYKWASKLVIGNTSVLDEEIVRWSYTIIEAQIPKNAVTGDVRVTVNQQEATWIGKVLIYDNERDLRIGMSAVNPTNASLWIDKGNTVKKGLVELAYLTEPVRLVPTAMVSIVSENQSLDVMGKKMTVEFEIVDQLPRGRTNVFTVEHPELGSVEIIRVELFDANNNLIEVYSDPISSKI